MNTLFVRTILLTVAVLFSVHLGLTLVYDDTGASHDDGPSMRIVAPDSAIFGSEGPAASAADLRSAVPVRPIAIEPAVMKPDLAGRPKLVDFRSAVSPVYEAPTSGTMLELGGIGSSPAAASQDDTAWLDPSRTPALGTGTAWVDQASAFALDSRFAIAEWMISVTIVTLAFFGVRRLQRPLNKVAQAARESASGCRFAAAIGEEGPGELRRVVRAFNEMLRRRNQALEEQAAALAALAQHMEWQATRLRSRALEVSEWHKRVAFVEDIDSFTDIAQQLLEVAGCADGEGPLVSVDGFLRDRFSMIGTMDGALFACDLKAGPQFVMSRPLLERVLRGFGTTGVFVLIAGAMFIVMLAIGLMGPRTKGIELEKISH